MSQKSNLILFSLIRSAIFGGQMSESEREIYSDKMLPELLKIAQKHDVAHLVGQGLYCNGLLQKEGSVHEEFRRQQLLAVYRYEQQNRAYTEICKVFEDEKIPYIPLKGLVVRDLYPEPWMRTSCDIDVLIRKESSEKAIRALCDAGFLRHTDSTTHDYSFMSTHGAHIELHYTLTQEGYFPEADSVLETVWENTDEEKQNGFQCAMTNEMCFFYHIAHMAKHFVNGGCGIRPLIDLQILREKMPHDDRQLRELLEKAKLLVFYLKAENLADVWFGGDVHDAVTEQMQQFILDGGVYGTIKNSSAIKAGTGESKFCAFLKLAFLPRKSLEVLYPKLREKPCLYTLYQIKRWFRIFDKRKRRKIEKITLARNSVTANEKNSVEDLLSGLGLL